MLGEIADGIPHGRTLFEPNLMGTTIAATFADATEVIVASVFGAGDTDAGRFLLTNAANKSHLLRFYRPAIGGRILAQNFAATLGLMIGDLELLFALSC